MSASWTAPSGYNTFYFRANPGTTIGNWPYAVMQDNVVDTKASFSAVLGQKYIVWVHTRDPVNGKWSSEISDIVTCLIPPPPTLLPGTPTISLSIPACSATGGKINLSFGQIPGGSKTEYYYLYRSVANGSMSDPSYTQVEY